MKATALFFLFLAACLVGGTLLTYPLMLSALVDAPPHRVATRLTQLLILLGIWPLLRSMGLANRPDLGLGSDWGALGRTLILGWLAGMGMLLVLSLGLYGLGIRLGTPQALGSVRMLVQAALQALGAGLLIALVEELFFRGALFSAIRRGGSAFSTLFWSSLLFALIHFLKPPVLPRDEPLGWSLSWDLFAGTFNRTALLGNLDSLLALFFAGLLLAALRERSGHIGYCIGVHAGWIFVIKLTRLLTDGNPASPYAFLVGSYDGVTGTLAAAWLGLLLLGGWWILRRGSTPLPD